MRHAKPFAVGLNCALGAELMRPYIAELARVADTLVSAYPNAGLPNAMGEYDETPDDMAGLLDEWAERWHRQHRGRLLRHHAGPHPRHRRRGREVRQAAPRAARSAAQDAPVGAGAVRAWREVEVTNARARFHQSSASGPTSPGSAKFRKLIEADDYPAALEVARQQVEAGARCIDVNMDEGLLDSEAAMVDLPQPDRRRAGHRARAGDDRLIQMGGDRGRAEMRAGQGDRQLDLHEGRRGAVPRAGQEGAAAMARPWW